jgi:DNA-binding transcriptional ArsR family regulator
MRALAHPVRLSLLEAFGDTDTLTATEAGERVGESSADASFHLRQLAKHGFVEEAEGGTGRRRPWKLRHKGTQFRRRSRAARSPRRSSRSARRRRFRSRLSPSWTTVLYCWSRLSQLPPRASSC